jgi:uncharacterized spore protein YtfJ
MRTKDLIQGAVEHLQTSASTKTVYGTPITAAGRIVIPVAKISRAKPHKGKAENGKAENDMQENGKPHLADEGDGVMNGTTARPVGVVEITDDETKFVGFGAKKRLALTAVIGASIGGLFGWMLARKRA